MKDKLNQLLATALTEIAKARDLNFIRIKYLGRKSILTDILKSLKDLTIDQRKEIGSLANKIKLEIESAVEKAEQDLKPEDAFYDLTMPASTDNSGSLHPVRIMQQEIVEIFRSLGFSVAIGPELEDDWHNFTALNIAENHPARDDQDSFYVDKGIGLRTQTSSVQFRVLEKNKPPIRVVAPGKTFRRDEADPTHAPMFHQIEGLIVDQSVTFADLKGILTYTAKKIFGQEIKTRFRISFFPFVEPGAEMDISCTICQGKNLACPVCKGSNWLEILGCGMIHPQVLKNAGINPKIYQGFAFGGGIERPFMLKKRINHLKVFYENDLRFLNQFRDQS